MNKEVPAAETENWRNGGIRDRERTESLGVISRDNQGKGHNADKSINTLFWKPPAPAENGPASHCCLQGSGEEEVV